MREEAQETNITALTVPYPVMHRRLMHASEDRVFKLCKEANIKLTGIHGFHCKACAISKAKQQISRGRLQPKWPTPFQCVMVNSFEVEPKSLGGYRYTVHLKELYTSYHYIDFIKGKEAVAPALIKRLKWIKT